MSGRFLLGRAGLHLVRSLFFSHDEVTVSMTIHGISALKPILKKHRPSDVVVVTSKKIARAYPWAQKEIQRVSGVPVRTLFVLDGERAKDFQEFERLLHLFIRHNVTRKSIVVAMGGGSVGDIAGFVASVYMRGISYIQLPTTLLASVDSSIGGKVAANLGGYKNNIGVICRPIARCVEERFLKSLPRDQWVNGLGEVVKAGIIADPRILQILQHTSIKGIQNNIAVLRTLVDRASRVKERIVEKDPLEHADRRLLNFGHTVGHAVELRSGASHGLTVLFGMWTELSIQKELGFQYKGPLDALEDFFSRYDIRFADSISADYKALVQDKKVEGGDLLLPIVERVGHARVVSVSTKKYVALVRKALK